MIPLSIPNLSGNEWKYVKDCLDSNWISSVGSYVGLFEEKVAAYCGVKYAVATSNGTAALHVSLILAGVRRNDLVIVPNITFVASVNSIKYVNADPVLIDIDRHSWQMDLDLVEKFLQEETGIVEGACIHTRSGRRVAAIMPVHVLGNMCSMDRLMKLAAQYRLSVVEDATEALGSYYNGRHAGSFGITGCLSFNGNKIISTGGGGMILTNDEAIAKKAKHITTQAKADGHEYYHDQVGYNYRLVNILAAMGVAQMEQLPGFVQRKKEIASMYTACLSRINDQIRPQRITEGVNSNQWLYTVEVPLQKELLAHLRQHKIESRPFWVPMNQLPAFSNDSYIFISDHSAKVYGNCLSLPCSTGITDQQVQEVTKSIAEFYS